MRIKNTINSRGKRLVCRIYDTGYAGPFDRYTIAFKGYRLAGGGMVYPYLASSDNPFHPQGLNPFEFRAGSLSTLKSQSKTLITS